MRAMVASGAKNMRDGDREDLELHRRLSKGDREAFDELYRRYSPTAYGIAYRLTGQQLLAQDVVHDAFLALWRAPRRSTRPEGRSGASSSRSSTIARSTRSGGRSGYEPVRTGQRTSSPPWAKTLRNASSTRTSSHGVARRSGDRSQTSPQNSVRFW